MSDQEAQGEPSMEEILASIRRIISEDDPEGEAPEGGEAQVEEPEADDDDVLELTDEVAEDEEGVAEESDVEEESIEAVSEEDSIEDDFRSSMEEPEEDEIEEVSEEPEPESGLEAVEEDDIGDISFDEVEDEVEVAAVVEDDVDIDIGDDIDLDAPDAESILQEETQDSTSSALSEIARAAVVQRSLAIGTGKTLEDIVREALVPELKAWLDVRLGPMVERIVREEIKKMVRRAEDL
ncbi:DUF2497 domain-containing protein [Kiloniella sp. EL199]|uniref:DUF2497 domain-containing protein n=1 Tax=Kiloniella sp. EL199 TaxID=2107581 RepID=UPI000EA3C93D|nr:DUF2497 domain-containing protein [Kiloniella sp. EL199]